MNAIKAARNIKAKGFIKKAKGKPRIHRFSSVMCRARFHAETPSIGQAWWFHQQGPKG
ncbi:hypothetical protein ACF058_30400 [Streptomyces sp. NPDC015501]|uniref:hypothetical protein n=1 Tax=unclassified Streptomyces TaxID=2593676 RepID=UPI003700603E